MVVDVENDYKAAVFVDAVAHRVLAAAGPPHAVDGLSQWCADDPCTSQEWSGDELPGRERRRWREPVGQGAPRRRGQDQVIRRLTRHGAAA